MNQRLARLAAGVRGLSRIVISLNIPVPNERFVALRRRVLTDLAEKLSAHDVEGLLLGEMLQRHDGIPHDSAWHRLREGRGGPDHHRLQKQPQPLAF